jgi:hypothetical protein
MPEQKTILRFLSEATIMRSPLLLAYLFGASTLAFCGDTQPLNDRTGTCTLMVPANWSVTAAFGSAQSADKKVTVVVSSPTHGLTSLDDVNKNAPTLYPDDKVTKNSSSEFEMEGANQAGKPNVYRAIPAGGKLCIVEVVYQSGAAADAKAIVESMKPAK